MLDSSDHELVSGFEEEVVVVPGERNHALEASQYCEGHELVRRSNVIDKPALIFPHSQSIEATENVLFVVSNILPILIGEDIVCLRRTVSAQNDWILVIEDIDEVNERPEVMLDDDVALVAWRADHHFSDLRSEN